MGEAERIADMEAPAFTDCLLQMIDSLGSWGPLRGLTPQQKAGRRFLLRPDARIGFADDLAVNCFGLPDVATWHAHLGLFFRAVALTIERRRRIPVCSLIDVNGEGFGRGIVYAGRLVLVVKSLRGGQPSFSTLEQAAATGEAWVKNGLEWLDRYPEMAKL